MQRKPIFDVVRKMLGRGFTRAEVAQLDAALDRLESYAQDSVPCVPCPPALQLGDAGIALIRRFEGCARIRPDGLVEAYPDPGTGADPWTIGWGATGPGIDRGTVWTRKECDARLERDLERYAAEVAAAIGDASTTPEQFDAMVSFHYNTGAIGRATLTRKHCAGDWTGAADEFARWNRAGGRVMKGLARRRAAEAELYRATRPR